MSRCTSSNWLQRRVQPFGGELLRFLSCSLPVRVFCDVAKQFLCPAAIRFADHILGHERLWILRIALDGFFQRADRVLEFVPFRAAACPARRASPSTRGSPASASCRRCCRAATPRLGRCCLGANRLSRNRCGPDRWTCRADETRCTPQVPQCFAGFARVPAALAPGAAALARFAAPARIWRYLLKARTAARKALALEEILGAAPQIGRVKLRGEPQFGQLLEGDASGAQVLQSRPSDWPPTRASRPSLCSLSRLPHRSSVSPRSSSCSARVEERREVIPAT